MVCLAIDEPLRRRQQGTGVAPSEGGGSQNSKRLLSVNFSKLSLADCAIERLARY